MQERFCMYVLEDNMIDQIFAPPFHAAKPQTSKEKRERKKKKQKKVRNY